MGLPPQLGASSRRVRCRLSVRSQAIHPAAGYSSRRRLLIRRRRYYAAGYSFRRRRSRLKLHHRRHLSRDRDERAAARKHPTVFNQVAVLGEFG